MLITSFFVGFIGIAYTNLFRYLAATTVTVIGSIDKTIAVVSGAFLFGNTIGVPQAIALAITMLSGTAFVFLRKHRLQIAKSAAQIGPLDFGAEADDDVHLHKLNVSLNGADGNLSWDEEVALEGSRETAEERAASARFAVEQYASVLDQHALGYGSPRASIASSRSRSDLSTTATRSRRARGHTLDLGGNNLSSFECGQESALDLNSDETTPALGASPRSRSRSRSPFARSVSTGQLGDDDVESGVGRGVLVVDATTQSHMRQSSKKSTRSRLSPRREERDSQTEASPLLIGFQTAIGSTFLMLLNTLRTHGPS
mgnify:CR=1 FL=1